MEEDVEEVSNDESVGDEDDLDDPDCPTIRGFTFGEIRDE